MVMDNPKQGTVSNRPLFRALGLAWELGYTIAIPLVILALSGRLLDKMLGSSPWLLLTGVLLSIVASTWLVYRKTKAIVDESSPVSQTRQPGEATDQTDRRV